MRVKRLECATFSAYHGPLEVGLGRAASVMYGSMQWLGHWHCTTGPSGYSQPS